ncbi:hypothetical protein MXAN_7376 [Myxococcus xanthus DK 1622]|uniref:Uncharacterized protein n=1 Tax=Myxococcus xanthus (strain DK1622) TaxID=246197 RepID=Q1CVU0_MYXXD|nr:MULTISPECIES: hypothetical protein [Myxococcus]ABF90835.1 hypothetical protein MXAN_7376 [Myxococcus xanthus DK 1622]UYI21961.1 hypothetical protein N1129_37435 [Myxococcus xanthus]
MGSGAVLNEATAWGNAVVDTSKDFIEIDGPASRHPIPQGVP